ncbi:MAG: nucleotidyltransferase family protein [Acidimicrobiales bacterium]
MAAHGLPGATRPWPEAPLEGGRWAGVLSTAIHQRITGLLAQAIADDAFPVTPEQADEADRAHRASMVTAVRLERRLVRTAERLDAAGIDFRVLKGSAVAHLDFPDPALRSFGDNDLLVRPEQFDAAVAVLVAAGHHRKFPEPRPGFDRRFSKGSCLVGPDGYEVDLHRTLAMGPFGVRIRIDDLWSRPSAFTVGGRPFAALAPEVRFVHACIHAVLGDNFMRLATLRDVVQLQQGRRFDVARVRQVSAGWEADAVVAAAVLLAATVLGLEPSGPLGEWASSYQPTRRDHRELALYGTPDQSYAAKSFAAIRAIPGTRDKAAFALGLAFPARTYRSGRREGPLQRWRRGAGQVARAIRKQRR